MATKLRLISPMINHQARPCTLMVASRTDELERIVRSGGLGSDIRLERICSAEELLERLAPPDRLPHETDDFSVLAVVVDDDIEGGGNGFLAELLARRPALKLIWVAGRLDPRREVEVRRLGVFYIISRPVEPTLLARVIAKAVEHETTRHFRGQAG